MNNKGAILLSVGYGALLTALLGIVFATAISVVMQGTTQGDMHLQGVIHANNIIAQYKAQGEEALTESLGNIYPIEGISNYHGEINVYKDQDFIVLDVMLIYQYGNKTGNVHVRGYKYEGE